MGVGVVPLCLKLPYHKDATRAADETWEVPLRVMTGAEHILFTRSVPLRVLCHIVDLPTVRDYPCSDCGVFLWSHGWPKIVRTMAFVQHVFMRQL